MEIELRRADRHERGRHEDRARTHRDLRSRNFTDKASMVCTSCQWDGMIVPRIVQEAGLMKVEAMVA